MRLNSISFKLISSMLVITTLILSGLGFYAYSESEKRLYQDLHNDTQLLLSRLKLNLPPAIWNMDDEYLAGVLESEAKANFIDGIYIVDEKDRLLQGIKRQEGQLAFTDELPENYTELVKDTLVYLDRDSDSSNDVGFIYSDISEQKIIEQLQSEIQYQVIQVLLLNAILIVLFSIVISRMARPLGTLKDLASDIAKGSYDLTINIKRKDEIGELADSFTVMKEGIKKKVQDLKDLNEISQELAQCTSQNTALEKTLQALSYHSNVKCGSVYLYNKSNKLELASFFPPLKLDNTTPRVFEDGEGILGMASKAKEIIFVPDINNDPRFVSPDSNQDPEASPQKSKAVICVPLIDNNMCIGVLNLSGQPDEVSFVETDFEFSETISRQLVTTIKNIRMREVIEEQNRNLEEKVEERTAELRQKNNDIANMMANMHQGLFTITAGGLIHQEYAAFLEQIFETERIAGRNFADLLFSNTNAGSDAVDQNITGVDAIVGEAEMMYEFNAHCLMKEMTISMKDGREKILELDWDPIINEESEVSKLMVTVRDVTELKALEAAAEEQKLELHIIGEILSIDAKKFRDFLSSSEEFLSECRQLIEANDEKDLDTIARLFRSMHTIKGNARTYGLSQITDIVHEVESTYDDLRKNEESQWSQTLLLSELSGAEHIIAKYAEVFRDKLGRDSEAANGMSLDPEKVSDWLTRIKAVTQATMNPDVKGLVSDAYNMLLPLDAKPLDAAISDVIQSANSLADQLGKGKPVIEINDAGLLVKNYAHSTLNNIFMHVFRNAMDHGIESIEERQQKGKPEGGAIRLNITTDDEGANLSIRDDGRGIAISRIYKMAIEKGIYQATDPKPSAADIANLIFSSGFSTAEAVTNVSGRGVGMDAVKGFLEKEGGKIEVILDAGNEDDDYRSFTTNIKIPHSFFEQPISFS